MSRNASRNLRSHPLHILPGGPVRKTRLINYFRVTFCDRESDERLSTFLVDLPGFGYAKVAKSLKTDWESNLTNFIAQRKQIRVFVHLIDCRRCIHLH